VILQHDNARPHTANMIKAAIQELDWEILPHPPYSPELALSDYQLFRSLSNNLPERGRESWIMEENT
jgi:transposase